MFGDFFLLVRLYDTMQSYMIHFVLREKFLTNFPMGSQVLQHGLCPGLMSARHLSDLRIHLEMNPFPSRLAHGFLLMKRTAGMMRASASYVCLCQSPVLCIPASFRSSLSY